MCNATVRNVNNKYCKVQTSPESDGKSDNGFVFFSN